MSIVTSHQQGMGLRALIVITMLTTSPGQIFPSPVPAKEIPTSLVKVRKEAEEAEKSGKWDKALELYLKLYTSGAPSTEVRDRIRVCIRNSTQNHRQRDPAFQQYVISLSVPQSISLYGDALAKIHSHYAIREQATIEKLFQNGLQELDQALTDSQFLKIQCPDATDLKIFRFRQLMKETWKANPPTTLREARVALREVMSAAHSILSIRDGSAIALEFLCGACNGLDEFSAYVSPGPEVEASPIVQMASYGLLVTLQPNGLHVDGVIAGSWVAHHTAIQKGDLIAQLNRHETRSLSMQALSSVIKEIDRMIGIEITVTTPSLPDAEPIKYRLPGHAPTVFGAEMIQDGIGYVRLAAFRESTPLELDEILGNLKMRDLRVLIIDLRGNPGGSLLAGVEATQRLLPAGVIATTKGQLPEFSERVYSSGSGMNALDIPLVLLVDTRTMSAAELFASALKENNRATLVGLPTFGKGLVQAPIRLKIDGKPESKDKAGVLYLSIASVSSPRGHAINGVGITPHVNIADPEKQLREAINKAVEYRNGIPMGMR